MDTPLPPLQGYTFLSRVSPLLERLHGRGTSRDPAGNRELHFDRSVGLLLLYFFNPAITSLRRLRQATELDNVADATGGGSASAPRPRPPRPSIRPCSAASSANWPLRPCHANSPPTAPPCNTWWPSTAP